MGRLLSLNSNQSSIRLFVSAGLLLWSGLSLATTAGEAKQLLERMSSALQELSYQGVFVYRRDEDLSAMHVTHIAHQEGEQEVLVTLTGQEREITRNSRRFGSLSSSSAMDQLAAGRLAGIEDHYQLEVLGQDRAAGRYAKLVVVTPRDQYRYGYRLWIDEETGLLLKSDLLGSDERVLEQVMFTSLKLLDKPQPAAVDAPELLEPEVSMDAQTAREAMSWEVPDLPDGFQLANVRPADSKGGAEHMVFTDGLASVSVFAESAGADENAFVGVSRMGAVNAFGNVISGYQVTVVGEVPEAAVKRIGLSLRYKGR